jgi:hypothetical protein
MLERTVAPDPGPVEPGPVAASEVANDIPGALAKHRRVARRDVIVVFGIELQVGGGVPAQRREIRGEHAAGSCPRSAQDDQDRR